MKEQKRTVLILHDDASMVREYRDLMASVQLSVETHVGIHSLLANLDSLRMGCLILDVRMREMSGIELCRRLRNTGVVLPVIFVTAYGDVPTAVKAMQEGAFDFLQRPFREQYLLDRVHAALDKDRRDRDRMTERNEAAARFEALSVKERQVVDLIISGRTSKAMARELGIGLKTVDFHRANIMRKVGVETVGELVCLLFKGGYNRMVQGNAGGNEKSPPRLARRKVQATPERFAVCRGAGVRFLERDSADSSEATICRTSGYRERAGTALQSAEVESM